MKAVLALLLSFGFSSLMAQKKEIILKIDSAHVQPFLVMLNSGKQVIWESDMPVKSAKQLFNWTDSMITANLFILQSWQPKPEPPKKDTTTKKLK